MSETPKTEQEKPTPKHWLPETLNVIGDRASQFCGIIISIAFGISIVIYTATCCTDFKMVLAAVVPIISMIIGYYFRGKSN